MKGLSLLKSFQVIFAAWAHNFQQWPKLTKMMAMTLLISIFFYALISNALESFQMKIWTLHDFNSVAIWYLQYLALWYSLHAVVIFVLSGICITYYQYFLLGEGPVRFAPFQFSPKAALKIGLWNIVLYLLAFLPLHIYEFLKGFLSYVLPLGHMQLQDKGSMPSPLESADIATQVVLSLFACWLYLRLSPKIVAMSMGSNMRLIEAWRSSKKSRISFVMLSILLALSMYVLIFAIDWLWFFALSLNGLYWLITFILLIWVIVFFTAFPMAVLAQIYRASQGQQVTEFG